MSSCRYCGGEISWVERPAGGYYPPFEFNIDLPSDNIPIHWVKQQWYTKVGDKEIRLTRHSCPAFNDPNRDMEDLKALQLELCRVNRKLKQTSWSHERLIKLAQQLSVQCPKCWAQPFHWCKYVNFDDDGTRHEMTKLHHERGKPDE